MCLSLNYFQTCNFKIIKNINFNLDNKFTIISGKNGAGKTSVLESIYYCVNGKSFLTTVSSRLVNFNENYFFIKSVFGDFSVTASYDKITDKKVFKLNNSKEKVLNLSLKFPFFVFHNSSLSLVRGNLSDSYSFFNKILLRMFPIYLQAYREYIKSLSIKRDLLRKDVKNDIINSWNRVLEKRRKILTEKRIWLVDKLNSLSCSNIKIKYLCNNENKNLSDFLYDEVAKKRILAGSHKDRFLILKDGKEVRYFSSSGQQKSVFFEILVSLGLLFLKEVNKKPVLLLDDFDSEFDKLNMEKVLESVMDLFQIVLTTTDYLKYSKYNFKLLNINKGLIEE
jgi:DNA replication and repair protein RecF